MTIFNKVHYQPSTHAEERTIERTPLAENRIEARKAVSKLASTGRLIQDFNGYRYIQNGAYYLPCIKTSENQYYVTTLMTWDMVKHRLQSVVDYYSNTSPTIPKSMNRLSG